MSTSSSLEICAFLEAASFMPEGGGLKAFTGCNGDDWSLKRCQSAI